MQRRTLLILSSIVLLVVIIALSLWVFTRQPDSATPIPQANTNVSTNEIPEQQSGGATTATTETTEQTATLDATSEAAALRVIRIATERYGTYSNRNNFENIINVQPFMTEKYKAETQKFIDQYEGTTGPESTNDFYGITTSVLSMATNQFSEKNAIQVTVGTQRSETVGDSDPRVFTQDAIVNAVYVNETWKIDAIQWK